MRKFPIGVIVESFRTDTTTAIKTAAEMGVQGLQMYCTYGEHAPENMSKQQRRELLDMVSPMAFASPPSAVTLAWALATPKRTPSALKNPSVS